MSPRNPVTTETATPRPRSTDPRLRRRGLLLVLALLLGTALALHLTRTVSAGPCLVPGVAVGGGGASPPLATAAGVAMAGLIFILVLTQI